MADAIISLTRALLDRTAKFKVTVPSAVKANLALAAASSFKSLIMFTFQRLHCRQGVRIFYMVLASQFVPKGLEIRFQRTLDMIGDQDLNVFELRRNQ
uniref:Uncharacterized protein n=1 Tax=Romanomermis culicivorax TaxID=13658 RepID=A0A915L1I4_ROMCU